MSARLYTGTCLCLVIGAAVVWGLLGDRVAQRARAADTNAAHRADSPASSCDETAHHALVQPLILRSEALVRRVAQLEREVRTLRAAGADGAGPAPTRAAPSESTGPSETERPASVPQPLDFEERRAVLDTELQRETRDAAWEAALADELERRLADPDDGNELVSVACGRSFCRVELAHADEEGIAALVEATTGLPGVLGVSLSPLEERADSGRTIAYLVREGQSSGHPALQ